MKNKKCDIVQDLLPGYQDGLTSDASNKFIEEHLEECGECSEINRRLKEPLKVDIEISAKPGKKLMGYIYGIRFWYFLCPFIALVLVYYNLASILHIYELLVGLFGSICIASQFFSGISYGFDYEQYNVYKKSEAKAKKTWGKFYTSPIFLSLPCFFVIVCLELPRLLAMFFSI